MQLERESMTQWQGVAAGRRSSAIAKSLYPYLQVRDGEGERDANQEPALLAFETYKSSPSGTPPNRPQIVPPAVEQAFKFVSPRLVLIQTTSFHSPLAPSELWSIAVKCIEFNLKSPHWAFTASAQSPPVSGNASASYQLTVLKLQL